MALALLVLFFLPLLGLAWMFREAVWYQIIPRSAFVRKKLSRPLRILHLSDIHFSGEDRGLGRFFEKLGKEDCDFVFITGDIFDCPEGAPQAALFKKLKSRHGVYAVFGNHDYYNYGAFDLAIHYSPGQGRPHQPQPLEVFEKVLADAGVRLLRNETVEVKVDGNSVLIHGLDDPITGHANVREAMRNFKPAKLNVLLTHSIDVFLDIGENEIDLSFSGHSHGGQVCLPGIGPLLTHTHLGRQYAQGVKTLKGAACSISRGIGTSRFYRIRLLCPPEAVLVEVKKEKEGN